MKKRILYTTVIVTGAIMFFAFSCSTANNAYDSLNGAWLSSEVSETYVDDYKGTIKNSYEFKSALVITNNEFMWNYWGEFGNYKVTNNGKDIYFSFEQDQCPDRCIWELVSYNNQELVFQKIENIVGTDYNTTISFERI